jgi:hypothetical protein
LHQEQPVQDQPPEVVFFLIHLKVQEQLSFLQLAFDYFRVYSPFNKYKESIAVLISLLTIKLRKDIKKGFQQLLIPKQTKFAA